MIPSRLPAARCERTDPPNIHIYGVTAISMDDTSGDELAGPMDRVARITLTLGGFMLVLLIAAPFTFQLESSGYFASYVIYSLFLTSIGVIIGVSLMWLNDPRRKPMPEVKALETSRPMLSEAQKKVVDALSANGNSMWQAELVRETGFTDSKASRLLSRMEAEGHIRRIRDGMGKRVELTAVES